jgi:predicted enzyme related to lactoylglutathione lyase
MTRLYRWGWTALLAPLAAVGIAAASPLGPDGEPGRMHPGKFTWLELATEDPGAARAFYGAVFGWRFRTAEGAPSPYEIIEGPAGKVGGMFRRARPPGAPVGSRWLGLISIKDPARAAEYVRSNGGEVIVQPVNIAGRGTHAVFRDAQGAVFGVLAASGGDPPDDPVLDGEVFWMDLFTPAPAEAARFYAALVGYEATEVRLESGRARWLLASEDVARGGIVPLPAGRGGPGWMPYILVADVGDTLRRVQAAGGKVVVAPRADLLDRNLAVISDPAGGTVGIVNLVARVEPLR